MIHLTQYSTYLGLSVAISISLLTVSCGAISSPQPPASEPSLEPSSELSISSASSPASFTLSTELPEPIPASQPWHIAYVLKTQATPYWQRVKESAIATGEDLGIDIHVLGADLPQTHKFVEDQIHLIVEELERGKLDGLIIGPTDSLRLVPVIKKVIEQGIPVIAMDTPLDTDAVITFVGFDNQASGKVLGEWVVQQLVSKGTHQGKVLILEGARHHDNAIERHNGFLAGLSTGDITVLATQSANWDQAEAQMITHEWLKQYSHIDAIVAANDEMALGAIAAINEHNRDNILVTGFDGSQNGREAIQTGQLAATLDQIPEQQTRISLELMVHHLEHKTHFPTPILLGNVTIITRGQHK